MGGHGTPCSPHIPHLPQDHSRVFLRMRDDPAMVLGLCRSWKRMQMAGSREGASFLFQGDFASSCTSPQSFLAQQWPGGLGALG